MNFKRGKVEVSYTWEIPIGVNTYEYESYTPKCITEGRELSEITIDHENREVKLTILSELDERSIDDPEFAVSIELMTKMVEYSAKIIEGGEGE